MTRGRLQDRADEDSNEKEKGVCIRMGAFGPSRRERLEELTMATSCAIGAHPQCITGVALLVELARRYGIDLTPRAVGLAGQSRRSVLASGVAAREHLASHGVIATNRVALNEDADWPADSPFRHSGHMVAVDETSSLLMDPSLEQFVAGGFPNVVLVTPVDLSEADWGVRLSEESFLVYLLSADRGGWEDGYKSARRAVGGMADEIVLHLRSGGAANTHSVRLDLDGAILV